MSGISSGSLGPEILTPTWQALATTAAVGFGNSAEAWAGLC